MTVGVGVAADGEKPLPANGDRLCTGACGVSSPDASIANDEVGFLSEKPRKRYGGGHEGRENELRSNPSHDGAASRLNGQRLVFHDQSINATQPNASTVTPNRMTRS